jgi:polysaccharide biosynthesis transport protein
MAFDPITNQFVAQNGVKSNASPGNGSPVMVPYYAPIAPQPEPQVDEEDDEVSLQQIFTVLRRRLPILVTVSLASMGALSALIFLLPSGYTGTFELVVEPVTKGSGLADSLTSGPLQALTGNIGGSGNSLDYISQIRILRSETLLEPTIQKIQVRYRDIDYKTLMKQLKISRPKDSKILEVTYDGRDRNEINFVLKQLSDAFINYSISDRQINLKRGVEFTSQQIDRQRRSVTNLEGVLEKFRRQNDLVDPKTVAEAISNQLQAVMAEQRTTENKLASAKTLYQNLQAQTRMKPETAIDVATLSEAPIYQAQLAKLREIDSKIAIESARFTNLTPALEALQDQRKELLPLLQVEAQRVMGTKVASAEQAESIRFQGSVGRELTKQLVESANQIQVLETQRLGIAQAIGTIRQQTQGMAGVARQYGQIQRDLEIATASLGRLMVAQENLQLESTRQSAPWELISKLDTPNSDHILPKSNTLVLVLLGVLASLIMGLAAALIAEQLDRVFHTVEELKELQIPCLGAIPFNKALDQDTALQVGRLAMPAAANPTVRDQKNRRYMTTFMEAFYSLDANIRLLSSDDGIRTVTITSTTPADGKSTISTHLAWAAVTLGRKVLIIDTDMRRPQVHLWFGISNLRGLSNVLTSDVEVTQLIQESPQDSNLHILTAGPMPPAPGRLLASNKMGYMMKELEQKYDLIICDAPPVLGFADAKLTAANTDGIILVVGIGKTDRNALMEALDEIKTSSQTQILGLVANGIKNSITTGSHYYERYYNQPVAVSSNELIATQRR